MGLVRWSGGILYPDAWVSMSGTQNEDWARRDPDRSFAAGRRRYKDDVKKWQTLWSVKVRR